jgi:hypothetical protein
LQAPDLSECLGHSIAFPEFNQQCVLAANCETPTTILGFQFFNAKKQILRVFISQDSADLSHLQAETAGA